MGEAPHVLLVDRDKLAAEVYQLGLEQAGIRVTMVADANSFSKAIEEPPDALVIEWEMLDVAGDEMLKQLALDARMAGRSVFVLINLISRVNDKTGTLSRELGATEWLVKSATAPDLLAATILGALDCPKSASTGSPEPSFGFKKLVGGPGFDPGGLTVPNRPYVVPLVSRRVLSCPHVLDLTRLRVLSRPSVSYWFRECVTNL